MSSLVVAGLALAGPPDLEAEPGTSALDCRGQPAIFLPGILSRESSHDALDWLSPEGTHLFVSRAARDFSSSRVFEMRLHGGEWREKPASFSTGPYDASFAVSPGRDEGMFTSTRESKAWGPDDWNIWRVPISAANGELRFESPELLPAPVNSEFSECCAVYGGDGGIFFSSDRSGKWSIYHAELTDRSATVELLPNRINESRGGAWPNQFDDDRNALLLSSIRDGGAGGDDIYIAFRGETGWTLRALPGGLVNGPGYEDNARIFGGTLFWSSRGSAGATPRGDTTSSVYMIDLCPIGTESMLDSQFNRADTSQATNTRVPR